MKKNKLIICTVGTSISNGCPSQRNLLSKRSLWDDDASDFEKEISEKIINTEEGEFRKISAEINSIDRLSISDNDRIVLLSSDNAPGKACSKCLQQIISEHYNIPKSNITIERVEGLQVYDSTRLKKIGLNNFIATTLRYLDDKSLSYQYDIIINPTGGFKGVLPFLTILGMMYAKKTIYIFEFSEELIYLPPLPFTFDLNIFNRVKPALEYIDQEIAVPEQEYFSKIKNYTESERELFLSFVEPFEDKLTISSLANCFLSIEKESEQPIVLKKILDEIQNDNSLQGLALKRLISKVSSPLWRNNHSENWYTTDLIIIKQPRTAERLAGFVKNNTFHVTHAFRNHDEYETKLVGCSVKDYANDNFVKWTPSEDLGIADADDKNGMLFERDQLLIENKTFKEQQSSLKEQLDFLNLEKEENFRVLDDCKKKIEALRRVCDELRVQIADDKNKADSCLNHKNQLIEINKTLKDELRVLNEQANRSFLMRLKNILGLK